MKTIFFTSNNRHPDFYLFGNNVQLMSKYGLRTVDNIYDADNIFYATNMGWDYFRNDCKNFWTDDNERWNAQRDFRNIRNLANISNNQKLIIYHRSDGADNIDHIFDAIINMGIAHRTILIKDFNFTNSLFDNSEILTTQDNGGYYHHLYKILHTYPNSLLYNSFINKCATIKINPNYYNLYKRIQLFTFKFKAYSWIYQNYEIPKRRKLHDIFYVKHARKTFDGYLREVTKQYLHKCNTFSKFMQTVNGREYDIQLANSKICISTWGYGECLIDDFKSIMNESVLLKTDTSHAIDYYGIFSSKQNLAVSYSITLDDLQIKIENILKNYDYFSNIAKQNKQRMLIEFSEERHIQDFCKIVLGENTLKDI